MKKIHLALHWRILIGIALGFLYGLILSDYTQYVGWMGDMFLRAIKMVVIPVVFTALITGMSNLGKAADLGRIAGKTISYYLVTTLIACCISLLLVNLLKPGVGADLSLQQTVTELSGSKLDLMDHLIQIVPDNVVKSMTEGNMLSVIFFAILVGFSINMVSEKSRTTLTNFFTSLNEVVMKFTHYVICCAPFGLFGVIAKMVGTHRDGLGSMFGSLGFFAAVVVAGCLIQGLIVLPSLLKLFTGGNPFKFIKQMGTALLTVFSTASSAAALPIEISDIQSKTGVSGKIAGFCLPLGNTINMNGTALYECVAAMFIAQAYGIELTISQQIIVVLTSLLAAVGTAGIPMAGLVMLAVVLGVAGLPLEGIGIVLVVEQPLDMIRSTINTFGDMCGACVVAKSEGEKLNI